MRYKKYLTCLIFASSFLVFSSISSAATPPWLSAIVSDCEAGVTQECLNAGVAYSKGTYRGKKVGVDKAKASSYIKRAVKSGEQNCMQGDSQDCYTIGLLYFEGGGIVPNDIPRGLQFLQRSCRAGHKPACAWLDNSGLQM